MRPNFGDGSEAPPLVSRETIELQRACNTLIAVLRKRLPDHLWINAEADIAPALARIVIHYADSPRAVPELMKTVELDLHPGLPLGDREWIADQAALVAGKIERGESDLVIARELDYLRLTDRDGQTIFEQGKAVERSAKK